MTYSVHAFIIMIFFLDFENPLRNRIFWKEQIYVCVVNSLVLILILTYVTHNNRSDRYLKSMFNKSIVINTIKEIRGMRFETVWVFKSDLGVNLHMYRLFVIPNGYANHTYLRWTVREIKNETNKTLNPKNVSDIAIHSIYY